LSPQDAGLVCRGPVCRAILRATAQAGPARFGTRETPPKPGAWTGHHRKVIARVQRSATRRHVRGLTLAHKCHSRESLQVLVLRVSSSRRAARASGDSQESGRPFDFGVVWWRSLRKNNPPLVISKPALLATKPRFGMTICLGIFKLHHFVGLCCVAWKLRESSGGISPPTQPGPEPGLAPPVLLPAGLRQV
jgi:hypothetical protein